MIRTIDILTTRSSETGRKRTKSTDLHLQVPLWESCSPLRLFGSGRVVGQNSEAFSCVSSTPASSWVNSSCELTMSTEYHERADVLLQSVLIAYGSSFISGKWQWWTVVVSMYTFPGKPRDAGPQCAPTTWSLTFDYCSRPLSLLPLVSRVSILAHP